MTLAKSRGFNFLYGAFIGRFEDEDAESGLYFDERSGMWGIGGDEYASPVTHCPWCGELLPTELQERKDG